MPKLAGASGYSALSLQPVGSAFDPPNDANFLEIGFSTGAKFQPTWLFRTVHVLSAYCRFLRPGTHRFEPFLGRKRPVPLSSPARSTEASPTSSRAHGSAEVRVPARNCRSSLVLRMRSRARSSEEIGAGGQSYFNEAQSMHASNRGHWHEDANEVPGNAIALAIYRGARASETFS